MLAVTLLSATAQRLRHLQPGRREQGVSLGAWASQHPLPHRRGFVLGGPGFMGIIPAPIAPGRGCCNPSRSQNPGAKPELTAGFRQTPQIVIFNHFHPHPPQHFQSIAMVTGGQHSLALPAHEINAVTHRGEGNQPETCP